MSSLSVIVCCHVGSSNIIALFPGPAQLSVACSTKSGVFVRAPGEPENKANYDNVNDTVTMDSCLKQ